MTDGNRELVPDNWILVKESAAWLLGFVRKDIILNSTTWMPQLENEVIYLVIARDFNLLSTTQGHL